eukprot:514312-Amphidinium_carterae.1
MRSVSCLHVPAQMPTCEQVPQGHQVQVMARAGEEDVSYVDLFYEGDQDDDLVDMNVPDVQEVQRGDE